MSTNKNTTFGIGNTEIDSETEELVFALDSSTEEVRQEAIHTLTETGIRALPGLIRAFGDPSKKDLMGVAGEILTRWGDPVYSLLGEILETADPGTRACAAGALGYLGKPAGPFLVAALHDPFRDVKYRAALSLVRIGWTFSPDQVQEQVILDVVLGETKDLIRIKKSAFPYLIELLDDEDYRIKVQAIKGLGEIKSSRGLSRIVPLIKSDELEVRSAVVEALGKIGNPKVIPFLVHALSDISPYVRIEAVWSLEKLGWAPKNNQQMVRFLIAKEQWGKLSLIDAEALPALLPALLDENPNIRNNITQILLERGTAAIPALHYAQKGTNENLRNAAAEVLEQIRKTADTRAPSKILQGISDDSWLLNDDEIPEDQMLSVTCGEPDEEPDEKTRESPSARVKRLSGLLSDPDPAIRVVAVEELRATGLAGLHPLTDALKDPDNLVRSAAAESLGSLKCVQAVPALIRTLRTDPEKTVKISSARALGSIQDTYAIPSLAEQFSDADPGVRAASASALGYIGKPALHIVLSKTRDSDAWVRSAAYLALGTMQDPAIITPVVRGFADRDPVVRASASLALDTFAHSSPRRFLEIIPGFLLAGNAAERAGILDTLAKTDDEQVLWIAYTLREDPDPVVRKKALALIEDREPALISGSPQDETLPEDEQAVRDLVTQLSDANPIIRKKAEITLKKTGPAAARVLIVALRDSTPAIRETITDIIATWQDGAVNVLIDAIHDDSPVVREVAVKLLGEVQQERAVYALGWALYGEKDQAIRKMAAEALGKTGSKSGISPLVHSLADIPEISLAAIDALGKIGGTEACDALVAFLGNANDDAIPGIAHALFYCGERTREILTQSLMKNSPAFRLNVAKVLDALSWQPDEMSGKIQYLVAKGEWEKISALGLPALECLIASFDDDVQKSRFEVARIIGHLGEPARIPLVKALSDKRPQVREGCVLALGYLGLASAKNIAGMLKDPVASVRYAAAQSLDRAQWVPEGEGPAALYDVAKKEWDHVVLHKTAAVPALVRVLGDRDFDVQSGAIRTLGVLGDPRAVDFLILLAEKTEDIRVVQAVIPALGQMTGPKVRQFLQKSLSHPVFAVRSQAAQALEKTGWVPRDTAENVRFLIALQRPAALVQMGSPVIPFLIEALGDDQVLGRLVITETLISLGEDAITGLTAIIKSENKQLHREARAMLSLLKKREKTQKDAAGQNTDAPSGDTGISRHEDIKARLARIRESLEGADEITRQNAADLLAQLGQPAVPDLIRLAGDKNPDVKIAALHALGRVKSADALPVLIPLLSDPDPDIRRTVTESLGCIRDSSVIPRLIERFRDQNAAVRFEAVCALAGMGNFAVHPVLEAAENREPEIRAAALETLGKFPDPVILYPLVKGLSDTDAHVRQTAAKVLGSLVKRPDSGVIDILTKIQSEGDIPTRLSSLDALIGTDDIRALDLLNLLTHDDNERIRTKAQDILSLKENGTHRDSPNSSGVQNDGDISRWIHDLADSSPDVRNAAAASLQTCGREVVIPLLTAFSRSPPETGSAIIRVLDAMGGTAADELEQALEHDDTGVRNSAARILGKIHSTKSVPALGHALYAEPDPKTRVIIAESLGFLGDRRCAKALIDVLSDPSRDVVIAAIMSLGLLQSELAVQPLIRQLDKPDEDIVIAAADSIREIGEPARPALVVLLRTGDHTRKAIAANILECLKLVPLDPVERAYFLIGKERWYDFEEIGEAALGPLAETLGDKNVHIRLGAVNALAKIGGTGTILPLITALNDPSPIVRLRAENALVNVGIPVVDPLGQALSRNEIRDPSGAMHILQRIGQHSRETPKENPPEQEPPEDTEEKPEE